MMDDKNKTPEDEPTGNEVESPVDGPTPDWMRLATSAGSSGSSLTDENTPAWLRSIRAGQGLSQEGKTVESPKTPPAAAQADDSMSDLERLLAEEGIDLGSVTEERPEGSGGMSARDWLIATSSEEIIRNKLGTQPEAEEPSPPPPTITPASAGSMSDLERLLAEEGIDLGAVSEERPEGSGGMSARDWLIATSSEEIIRNKLGTQPEAEEPTAPPPSISFSDDKMVVEEDLPDWLQEIADDASEPDLPPPSPITARSDQLVVNEELPDWLQEIADETPVMITPDDLRPSSPVAQSASFPAAEDKMVVTEDLPDWLQDIAAEETSGSTEPSLSFTELEPELPPSQTAAHVYGEDKMVVEEDLPDWLQDIAAEPVVMAAPVAEFPTSLPLAEDKVVIEEELPDWLQEIDDEPLVSTEPELLPSAQPTMVEDKMVVEDDLPDWLREASEEETELAPSPLPSSSADKMVVAEDLPDWLREVEAAEVEADTSSASLDLEMADSDLDDLESDEDLPDWLREVEVSSLEENLTTPLVKSAEAPPEPAFVATPPLAEDELDLLDETDLPAWLKEVQERDGPEPAVPMSQAAAEVDLSGKSADLVIEDELPDWLREAQEEEAPLEFGGLEPPPVTAQADIPASLTPSSNEEDLPDWLRETEFGLDEPFEPSEPSPEPLVEDMPDWLQDVEEEDSEELVFEATPPTPPIAPSSLTADGMVDEEGLPDWLRDEVAEEVEPLTALEEPLAIPEPIIAEAEEGVAEEALIEEVVEVEDIISIPPAEPESVPVSEPLTTPAPTSGIPDWLQKLRQVEDEGPVPVPLVPLPLPVMVTAVKPAPQPVYAQVVAPPPDLPADAEERLKQARTTRDKGDIEGALPIYNSLVANGAYLDKIIEDMQQTIKTNPGNYLLFQLMGDAMMRDGRLQSALNAYREALSRL